MIQLDLRSTVPPYDQVRAQVTAMVESGVLPAGARLPPIRQLAGDLGVSASTIARAYRELESDGLIVTKGRNGTVVADGVPVADDRARWGRVTEAAAAYARTARHAGIDVEQAITALRQVY